MSAYRKKPVVIEASQWFKDGDHPAVRRTSYMEVATELGTSGCSREEPYWSWETMGMIDTLEGKHAVIPGDWIITGVKGEHYACKPDIFAATYELASPANTAAATGERGALLNAAAKAGAVFDDKYKGQVSFISHDALERFAANVRARPALTDEQIEAMAVELKLPMVTRAGHYPWAYRAHVIALGRAIERHLNGEKP